MNDHITIGNLKPIYLTEMYMAFLDAFSDYMVPFRLTKDQFVSKFVNKLKLNFPLSAGAFDNDILAGFIFTAINSYKGKLTAYNGGTGVRPAQRGQQLTRRMYDFLVPQFIENNVSQCVLEVLVENDRAIRVYRAIGFEESQYFTCFKLENLAMNTRQPDLSIEIFSVATPDWDLYAGFADQAPSFLDSQLMISEDLVNDTIIEAHYEDQCIAYAVFQPVFGRISQIAVAPEFRNRGVGSSLVKYVQCWSKQKSLSVINIEQRCHQAIRFFQHLGFKTQLNQYEMILKLDQ